MGLKVAPVLFKNCAGRDILLVERFDRVLTPGGVHRKHMLSALSLLGLHEMEARYASYLDLADLYSSYFKLRELCASAVE